MFIFAAISTSHHRKAKYNKQKKTKRKKKNKLQCREGAECEEEADQEEGAEPETKAFTLKCLIRALHINTPVYQVMCLLGKRYIYALILEALSLSVQDGSTDDFHCQ